MQVDRYKSARNIAIFFCKISDLLNKNSKNFTIWKVIYCFQRFAKIQSTECCIKLLLKSTKKTYKFHNSSNPPLFYSVEKKVPYPIFIEMVGRLVQEYRNQSTFHPHSTMYNVHMYVYVTGETDPPPARSVSPGVSRQIGSGNI